MGKVPRTTPDQLIIEEPKITKTNCTCHVCGEFIRAGEVRQVVNNKRFHPSCAENYIWVIRNKDLVKGTSPAGGKARAAGNRDNHRVIRDSNGL
jgi:hypothetical protein